MTVRRPAPRPLSVRHPALGSRARRPLAVGRRALRPVLAGALLLATGGCGIFPTAGNNLSQGELLLELSDTINELRAQDALFQEELDSLRTVVARQDSVLARLAAAAGVPLPTP